MPTYLGLVLSPGHMNDRDAYLSGAVSPLVCERHQQNLETALCLIQLIRCEIPVLNGITPLSLGVNGEASFAIGK